MAVAGASEGPAGAPWGSLGWGLALATLGSMGWAADGHRGPRCPCSRALEWLWSRTRNPAWSQGPLTFLSPGGSPATGQAQGSGDPGREAMVGAVRRNCPHPLGLEEGLSPRCGHSTPVSQARAVAPSLLWTPASGRGCCRRGAEVSAGGGRAGRVSCSEQACPHLGMGTSFSHGSWPVPVCAQLQRAQLSPREAAAEQFPWASCHPSLSQVARPSSRVPAGVCPRSCDQAVGGCRG